MIEMTSKRMLITLTNGEQYMVQKGHNDYLYSITEDNHLHFNELKHFKFVVFTRDRYVDKDLGEIESTEERN